MTDDTQATRAAVLDALEPWIDTKRYYAWRLSPRIARILETFEQAIEAKAKAEVLAEQPCWASAWKPSQRGDTWAYDWRGRIAFDAGCSRTGYPMCPPCTARAERGGEE